MVDISERLLERSKREWAYISELEDIVLAKDAHEEIEKLRQELKEKNND